ncbi:MAG TPA: hypothetical protein VNG70_07575 [Candidatus Limnocylindria bacterium]|nr:hypothetical protein [Candidatus Limnocylindria bacterium]
MAHLSEGTLRRRFDDEDALTDSDTRHYATCAECQSRYASLAEDARAVSSMLAMPDVKVDATAALNRVRSTPAAQPRFGIRLPIMRPASRPVLGSLAAAAVIVALVVTGVAQNALNFFHPTTVQPVTVSVADLQSLSGLSEYGAFTWTKEPAPQLVTSAAEAATVSGLHVPVVATLPAGVSTTVSYAAMPQAVGVFTFDASKAAAAAAKAGKALPKMPAGMDGSKLTVTVGPAVVVIYGNLNAGAGADTTKLNLPQLIIGAATAPVVTSSGVTTQQLEDYLLSQPGVSPKLAAAIRAIKDPSTTLPIPIPVEYVSSTQVRVQGVDGVALGDNTGVGAAVIWIKNDTVYGVAGPLKQSAILDVANNLH